MAEGITVSPEGWPGLLFADVSVDAIRYYGKQYFGDEVGEIALELRRGEPVVHGIGTSQKVTWRTGTLVGINAERAVVGGAGAIFHVGLFELFRVNDAFVRSVASGGDPHGGHRVRVSQLIANPHAYDGVWVTVEGLHSVAMERSNLAGAWVVDGFRDRGSYYVLATGLWRSEYGHFGLSTSELVVETIERTAPSRITDVEADDVPRHAFEVVRVRGVVSQTPSRTMFGSVRVFGLPDDFDGLREVELVAVVNPTYLTVLEARYLGEVKPHRAKRIASVGDAAGHVGAFVRFDGTLEQSSYWPTIDGVEIVPPELYDAPDRFVGSSKPIHPVVVAWHERLRMGSLRVRVEGYVHAANKVFATRIDPIFS